MKYEIIAGPAKEGDNHFLELEFTSDDGKKGTAILAGATAKCIEDDFNNNPDEWKDFVVQKWRKEGESILETTKYLDPYANFPEDRQRIFALLKKNLVPIERFKTAVE